MSAMFRFILYMWTGMIAAVLTVGGVMAVGASILMFFDPGGDAALPVARAFFGGLAAGSLGLGIGYVSIASGWFFK